MSDKIKEIIEEIEAMKVKLQEFHKKFQISDL